MALFRSVCAASLLLALAACNKKDGDGDLAALDAQLTNNAADPAMKGALNDPILVDPQLVGQANRDAVRPADKPATGAVPVMSGDAAKAQAQAVRQAGGKLLSAPAPTTGEAMASTVTLGAVAREQAAALQLVEAFGDVTGHHAGLRGVVAAPLQAGFPQAQRVGRAQINRAQGQALEAVEQHRRAGEHHPGVTAGGQVVRQRDDQQTTGAGRQCGKVADFDDLLTAHRQIGVLMNGVAHRLIQIVLKKQRATGTAAHADTGLQFALLAEAKQFRHELADVGAVGIGKTVVNKTLQPRPQRAVWVLGRVQQGGVIAKAGELPSLWSGG